MDDGVKKDIWSVMEDFSRAPDCKDLSKMKSQYAMFVDAVGSKQVTQQSTSDTVHCWDTHCHRRMSQSV